MRGDEESSALSVFSLSSSLAAVGSWSDFKPLLELVVGRIFKEQKYTILLEQD